MRGIALSPQLFISFRHAGVDVMSRVEGHKGVRGGGTGGGNSLLTARDGYGLQAAKADRNSFATRLAR